MWKRGLMKKLKRAINTFYRKCVQKNVFGTIVPHPCLEVNFLTRDFSEAEVAGGGSLARCCLAWLGLAWPSLIWLVVIFLFLVF